MTGLELSRQRAVQGRHTGLGGGVVGQLGRAELAQNAGDGDNGTAEAAAGNAGDESFEGVEVGGEVGEEGAVNLGVVEVEQALAVDNGGIVDQNRRRAELCR